MKNNNRRTFFPLLLAAVVGVCLLPRKVLGKVAGARGNAASGAAATDANAPALAELIRKAPHTVAYSPKQRRTTGAL